MQCSNTVSPKITTTSNYNKWGISSLKNTQLEVLIAQIPLATLFATEKTKSGMENESPCDKWHTYKEPSWCKSIIFKQQETAEDGMGRLESQFKTLMLRFGKPKCWRQTDGRMDRRTERHHHSISLDCLAIWPKIVIFFHLQTARRKWLFQYIPTTLSKEVW